MSAFSFLNGKTKPWQRRCLEKQPEELAGSQSSFFCILDHF